MDWKELYQFWFGTPTVEEAYFAQRIPLWFSAIAITDGYLTRRFAPWLDAVNEEEWKTELRGRLTHLVLLDQIPRNCFRGTARAFAYDARALEEARAFVDEGLDKKLLLSERQFVYLPFEHSENLEDQQRCVALFRGMEKEAPPELTKVFSMLTEYAKRHEVIIERFGRFPHRNKFLGRATTEEEAKFLLTPGSSF